MSKNNYVNLAKKNNKKVKMSVWIKGDKKKKEEPLLRQFTRNL